MTGFCFFQIVIVLIRIITYKCIAKQVNLHKCCTSRHITTIMKVYQFWLSCTLNRVDLLKANRLFTLQWKLFFAREFHPDLTYFTLERIPNHMQGKKHFCLHMIGWWRSPRASPNSLNSGKKFPCKVQFAFNKSTSMFLLPVLVNYSQNVF